MNANITLSNNWFMHLFDDIELRLGSTVIERVQFPGIVSDVFNSMEDVDTKEQNGELFGFIPDSSNEVNDTIGIRQGDVAGADVAAVVASTNNAANKIC